MQLFGSHVNNRDLTPRLWPPGARFTWLAILLLSVGVYRWSRIVRFSFFMVQFVCMAWMGIHIAIEAAA